MCDFFITCLRRHSVITASGYFTVSWTLFMVAFLVNNGRWWCLKDLRTLPDLIFLLHVNYTPSSPPPRLTAKKNKKQLTANQMISSAPVGCKWFSLFSTELEDYLLLFERWTGSWSPPSWPPRSPIWSSWCSTHDLGHIDAAHLTWRRHLLYILCGYPS